MLYEKLGEPDKSHQAFNQILSSYPNSMYFDVVEEKLAHTEPESSS
jgi:outer membrane protein assembly factor BamD (BamD/ComL family)